jgi:hypothetical protein
VKSLLGKIAFKKIKTNRMDKRFEVESFLNDLKVKMRVFGIFFRDERHKNISTLLDFELTTAQRKAVIEKLRVTDFVEGPIIDKLHGIAELWVFGKKIKEVEFYIKISLGHPNSSTICISFHPSQHPMVYPF